MYTWLIGGDTTCDLVVDVPTVSAFHCRLSNEANAFYLEDLGSSNGTFVNGKKLSGKTRVQLTDVVTLGTRVPMPWPVELRPSVARPITIGSAADNDIVLAFPMISAYHAHLHVGPSSIEIEDLGSTNGTFLNVRRNRASRASLREGDVVYFGSFAVEANRLLQAARAGKTPITETHRVGESTLTIGRGADCDIVLNHPLLSSHHARIRRCSSEIVVEDLGSTNGTFINGRRITKPVPLKSGDILQLPGNSFTVSGSGELTRREYRGNFVVQADRLCLSIGGKRLVHDISLILYPTELVGLMGPSGAGKSLLIGLLNGYVRPSSGQVSMNQLDLHDNFDLFRGQIGYVPQEDIIHPALTVREALYFNARLRLPADFADSDIEGRIDKVVEQLGLRGAENVLIGSPEKRGISGGQRKRVNLAMELITEPSLLFLDEPTSGLSSEDALNVVTVLRKLADQGKTILITIHQPSQQAFRLLDNVAVIARDSRTASPGRLAYYGPAYPDAINFFCGDSSQSSAEGAELTADDMIREVAGKSPEEWDAVYKGSTHHKLFIESRSLAQAAPAPGKESSTRSSSWLLQTWTLARRNLTLKLRDAWNTTLLLAQAPIIAILIVLVFGDETRQTITPQTLPATAAATATTTFLLALAALWLGCSNSAREVVSEWVVYRRERMVNLKISAYILSKLLVLAGLCLIQCAVLLAIVHAGNQLQGSWPQMFGIMLLAALVGVSIGLLISVFSRTSEFAIAMLPIVILPMVILGGILQPLEKLNSVAEIGSHVMPSRWAFEALLLIETQERPKHAVPPSPNTLPGSDASTAEIPATSQRTRDMAEQFFPRESKRMGVRSATLTLTFMFVAIFASVGLVLRIRDTH